MCYLSDHCSEESNRAVWADIWKGFTTPIAIMTPFNVLSELATPISMACRHFGNILSGVVINGLIYGALAVASSALLGLLPGIVGDVLAKIPILDVVFLQFCLFTLTGSQALCRRLYSVC